MLPQQRTHQIQINSEEDFIEKLVQDDKIILYLHGNLGTRAGKHRRELYKVFSRAGYHVLIFDYRGYGDSTGSPCEDGVVADSLAVYKWITHHNPKASVTVWGHSLGTAIATKLVRELQKENDPPGCLVSGSTI